MDIELTAEWLGPEPARILWPDPETGPFVVRMHWASVNGIGRLVGIDLRSVETDDRSTRPQPVNTIAPNLTIEGTEMPARDQVPVPDPYAELTVEHWRSFKFGLVHAERARLLDETTRLIEWDHHWREVSESISDRNRRSKNALKRKRPRGLGLTNEHYAKVAEVYKAAQARGDGKRLQAIQNAFGGPDLVSRDMANAWRKRAQDLGYLNPPQRRIKRD